MPKIQASNSLFYFQSIKIILGPSDAWSMRQSTQRPSDPAYYIEDCRILRPLTAATAAAKIMSFEKYCFEIYQDSVVY